MGTPKSQLKGVAGALLEKEGWPQVQSGVEARLRAHPDGHGDEQFVLCRSQARAGKERAMLERQTQRLCQELGQVAASLHRQPEMNREKLGRRLGRGLGKYPAAAAVIEVTVRTVARPDKHVAQLLLRLGLDLPTRNRIVEPVGPPEAAQPM